MSPAQDGSLIQLIAPGYLSPAEAPYPYHESVGAVIVIAVNFNKAYYSGHVR